MDRLILDHIARAVVSGERRLGRHGNRLADAVACLITNRLAALGARGENRARLAARGRDARRPPFDPALVQRVMDRVTKHLGHLAIEEELGRGALQG